MIHLHTMQEQLYYIAGIIISIGCIYFSIKFLQAGKIPAKFMAPPLMTVLVSKKEREEVYEVNRNGRPVLFYLLSILILLVGIFGLLGLSFTLLGL